MKIGFDSFLNKYSLLKKTLLGLFTVSSAAGAQTIYQCTACPSGLSSNPGATSASQCFNPSTKGGASVIFSGISNWSGKLEPGWYRISLKGASGSNVSCGSSGGGCSSSYSSSSCTGYGGSGGTAYYIFYVSNTASANYTYNNGSPKLVVTESGKSTRTFQVTAGTSGSKYTTGSYGSVCHCSNGSAGSSSISGLTSSTDKSTGNVDNWTSNGGKLVRL
ncbi:hypothetical protein HDR60_03820 [bacterium]|nr:hypothetical protein [bacterium]